MMLFKNGNSAIWLRFSNCLLSSYVWKLFLLVLIPPHWEPYIALVLKVSKATSSRSTPFCQLRTPADGFIRGCSIQCQIPNCLYFAFKEGQRFLNTLWGQRLIAVTHIKLQQRNDRNVKNVDAFWTFFIALVVLIIIANVAFVKRYTCTLYVNR